MLNLRSTQIFRNQSWALKNITVDYQCLHCAFGREESDTQKNKKKFKKEPWQRRGPTPFYTSKPKSSISTPNNSQGCFQIISSPNLVLCVALLDKLLTQRPQFTKWKFWKLLHECLIVCQNWELSIVQMRTSSYCVIVFESYGSHFDSSDLLCFKSAFSSDFAICGSSSTFCINIYCVSRR